MLSLVTQGRSLASFAFVTIDSRNPNSGFDMGYPQQQSAGYNRSNMGGMSRGGGCRGGMMGGGDQYGAPAGGGYPSYMGNSGGGMRFVELVARTS